MSRSLSKYADGMAEEAGLLWHRAVQRFQEELEENEDYEEIIKAETLDDLLSCCKTLQSNLPSKRTALNSINRLGPRLDDFSAVIAQYSGADALITAIPWGSVCLMLNLASKAGETLHDVLDMLEQISVRLPRLKAPEENLPVDREFEAALLDLYTEVICFYARTVNVFRTHPHALTRRNAWEGLRADFDLTVRRMERMSSSVEGADRTSVRIDSKYKEVSDLIMRSVLGLTETLQRGETHNYEAIKRRDEAIKFHRLPCELSPRFWGREEALQAIGKALDPGEGSGFPKAFALYGMGGVGKTQIALEYANRNRDRYNAILWVAAENRISVEQSFRNIARDLLISKSDGELQDVDATPKVKNWLAQARKSIGAFNRILRMK